MLRPRCRWAFRSLFHAVTGAGEASQPTEPATSAAASPETFEALTSAQFDVLEAIAARLIPSDDNGPGATEARAAHFIDRALGGPLVAFRDTYHFGLAAVDRYALSSKGAPFTELSAPAQDAVLRDIENNVPTDEFGPQSSAFFNLVRAHTIQGMFCDPYHPTSLIGGACRTRCRTSGSLGGSVMGTSGSRNPTQTLQALAWRTADHVVQNWRTLAG